jgi:hypothetical protein
MALKTVLCFAAAAMAASITIPPALGQEHARVYELRTYTCYEGKLPFLLANFRDHHRHVFEKHGITNIAYWVPQDSPAHENTLIYVLAHASREAAKKNWDEFFKDPEFLKVAKDSEAQGKIVIKVESVFMDPTDFSPATPPAGAPEHPRVFELRTYHCNEGKLPDLLARFRNHTMGIFEKHGVNNIAYWVPQDAPAHENTLIYVIAHPSRDAAKQHWKEFGGDPEWQKVQKESEANGKIVSKLESVFMDPTDFSPMK